MNAVQLAYIESANDQKGQNNLFKCIIVRKSNIYVVNFLNIYPQLKYWINNIVLLTLFKELVILEMKTYCLSKIAINDSNQTIYFSLKTTYRTCSIFVQMDIYDNYSKCNLLPPNFKHVEKFRLIVHTSWRLPRD